MKRASLQAPPIEPGSVIRRNGREIEMVQLRWGLQPRDAGDRPRTVIRSEGRRFESHRCLIPASEFRFSRGGERYKFTLHSGDWFYFAGIWRPGSPEWPEAYAALTIEANEDVASYHDRQMAVIRREDRMLWLDHAVPEAELLRPLPARSFDVQHVARQRRTQQALAL